MPSMVSQAQESLGLVTVGSTKPAEDLRILSQEAFVLMIRVEQKRCERSGKSCILMLVDCDQIRTEHRDEDIVGKIPKVLAAASRETDLKGWYREGSQFGVIFTEIPTENTQSILQILKDRVKAELAIAFGRDVSDLGRVLVFRVFPQDWHSQSATFGEDDLIRDRQKGFAATVKRGIDILGSAAAIAMLSPVFLATAVAVKVSSRGPVIFRQKRVGQFGREFTFLKFRSMRVSNNTKIHEEYVKKLIAEGSQKTAESNQPAVYKLTKDPRITPIGRFLRKTSLDELPQFFNVLLGDMSLVGPRPPIPYEVEAYHTWHRQRLLPVKPGITGLWQVEGRSRVRFDDMVRMDLRYAQTWSVWSDLKLLLRTPGAVIGGGGAC